MSRSRRSIMAAAATCSAVAFIFATGCWVGAACYADIGTARIAISLTVLGTVLALVCAVTHLINCLEASHDETRKQINAALDKAAQRVADRVLLEIFTGFDKIAEDQNTAADRLDRAQRRWRATVGTDTPVDLQQWRERAADGAAQR